MGPYGSQKNAKHYSSLKSFLSRFKLFLNFLLSGLHNVFDFWNFAFLIFHDFFSFTLTWDPKDRQWTQDQRGHFARRMPEEGTARKYALSSCRNPDPRLNGMSCDTRHSHWTCTPRPSWSTDRASWTGISASATASKTRRTHYALCAAKTWITLPAPGTHAT